jgi:hypothetical protein
MGLVPKHGLHLGVELLVGMDSVSLRKLVVLQQFWLGMVTRFRMWR